MTYVSTPLLERQFAYLDELRESGVTNMFGAGPHLEVKYDIGKAEARLILADWMRTFSERHPA